MSRIETLLDRMTLAEKIGQLTMSAAGYAVTGPIIAGDSTDSIRDGTVGNLLNIIGAGPVHEMQRIAVEQSRLGIPLLIGLDIIHGHRTLFPIPLAEAALFDPSAWERTAREAAREAAADGLAMTFAPMLDVSRDPRWGRTAEGPGEDPLIGMLMAHAKVRGFQGDDLAASDSLAACAKHFCAYGPVMAGREYASVDVSERTLREVHLPPFEAAVRAGVETIMPAFTDLNGIPMTMHVPLLRDYLRGELGWDGVLISDYNAIGELIKHGVAADLVEAATLAFKAGVDVDMMSGAYRNGLPIAVSRGLVSEDEIDAAVARVLRLKERLGLFDAPYGRGRRPEPAATIAQRRALAREVGARSLTLLGNRNGALPLPRGVRRLCVLGPLADAPAEMRGPWPAAGEADGNVGVLAGLREGFPGAEIVHAPGVAIDDTGISGISAAIDLCEDVDALILCLGERANMSGEAASRASPELPGMQSTLAHAAVERARSRRIPVIAIVFSGRPLLVSWLDENVDALLAAWFPGSQAGHAIADVLSGRVSPGGRTPISWPRAVGQVPIFFAQRPGGRPFDAEDPYTSRYLDVGNDPLYPFGHGLGYGRFTYADLQVTPDTLRERDVLQVRVNVSNEGDHEAEETVFLFTRDKVASVARPLLELRSFAKIRLAAGCTGSVEMSVAGSELRFLDAGLRSVFEPGEIEVLVGPSADRTRLLAATCRLIG